MTSFNCKILFASFVERFETYEKYDSSSSLSIVRDSLSPLSLSLLECLSFVETGRNLTKNIEPLLLGLVQAAAKDYYRKDSRPKYQLRKDCCVCAAYGHGHLIAKGQK